MKNFVMRAVISVIAFFGVLAAGCGPNGQAQSAVSQNDSEIVAAAQKAAQENYVIAGTSWFSVGFVANSDEARPFALHEFRDVVPSVSHGRLSGADKLNGISDSGSFVFAYRVYRKRDATRVWSKWFDGPVWSLVDELDRATGNFVFKGSFTIENSKIKIVPGVVGIRRALLPIRAKDGELEVPKVKENAGNGFDFSAIH